MKRILALPVCSREREGVVHQVIDLPVNLHGSGDDGAAELFLSHVAAQEGGVEPGFLGLFPCGQSAFADAGEQGLASAPGLMKH
jgi:hypothetical protein